MNSSRANEPPINNPSQQVVGDKDEIVLEASQIMNEAREEIDAIPPDEEVHVVQPHAQQHGILETILDHVVYLPMIVTPQPRS